MATEVDICNLALGHLGKRSNVSSIDPPEGSAEAERCAQFYPMARDTLLEMHDWHFATSWAVLALLGTSHPRWFYTYAQPNGALRVLSVLPTGEAGSFIDDIKNPSKPFTREKDTTGAAVIYTNQEDAAARCTFRVTDTSKFSPLFVTALSWHLASFLAGPLVTGESGTKLAKYCAGMALSYLSPAKTSDANQQQDESYEHLAPWQSKR